MNKLAASKKIITLEYLVDIFKNKHKKVIMNLLEKCIQPERLDRFLFASQDLWYNMDAIVRLSRAVGSPLKKGGGAMEVKDALILMLMFGMFILALLSYLKKK